MKKLLLTLLALAACGLSVFANVKGDVNSDGYVTSADVTAIYEVLLGNDNTFESAGDVNGDGYVTSADVTFIYDILLGNYHPTEHEWVDLGLPSGTLWATMNVGADSPEDYGDYFAWGETTPKDNYYWSNYQWSYGGYFTITKYCTSSGYGYNGFLDDKIELDPEDDAATANWGAEWHMPSIAQVEELNNSCTFQLTTMNGVNGYLVTSKHNGASLFLPAAGFHWSRYLANAGSWAAFWSRTLFSSRPYYAYGWCLANDGFHSDKISYGSSDRCYGQSVRAVRVPQN